MFGIGNAKTETHLPLICHSKTQFGFVISSSYSVPVAVILNCFKVEHKSATLYLRNDHSSGLMSVMKKKQELLQTTVVIITALSQPNCCSLQTFIEKWWLATIFLFVLFVFVVTIVLLRNLIFMSMAETYDFHCRSCAWFNMSPLILLTPSVLFNDKRGTQNTCLPAFHTFVCLKTDISCSFLLFLHCGLLLRKSCND